MAIEVNNETEETKTGETSAPKTDKQDAAAQKPVEAAEAVSENSGEIDFASILEQFEQEQVVYHPGELVEGKVVGVSDHGVLVDFGYKSEGIIPSDEFPEGVENSVKVGDQVLFGKYAGTEVRLDGEELLVMREDDVMAVFDKK